MSDFTERLNAEKLELDNRREKLTQFINTTVAFGKLSSSARDLLIAQEDVMIKYSHILRDRIALLAKESPND